MFRPAANPNRPSAVGAKLKPSRYCLAVSGPRPLPGVGRKLMPLTGAARPDPPAISRPAGANIASLVVLQVGFRIAVTDPGSATPAEPSKPGTRGQFIA